MKWLNGVKQTCWVTWKGFTIAEVCEEIGRQNSRSLTKSTSHLCHFIYYKFGLTNCVRLPIILFSYTQFNLKISACILTRNVYLLVFYRIIFPFQTQKQQHHLVSPKYKMKIKLNRIKKTKIRWKLFLYQCLIMFTLD
jgi:hypothetical protein